MILGRGNKRRQFVVETQNENAEHTRQVDETEISHAEDGEHGNFGESARDILRDDLKINNQTQQDGHI